MSPLHPSEENFLPHHLRRVPPHAPAALRDVNVPRPHLGPARIQGAGSLLGGWRFRSTAAGRPPSLQEAPLSPILLGPPCCGGALTHPSPDCGFQRVGAGPWATSQGLGVVAGREEAGRPPLGGMGGDRGCRSHPGAALRRSRGGVHFCPSLGGLHCGGGLGWPRKAWSTPASHLCALGSPRPPLA